jgi:hypothetical protein
VTAHGGALFAFATAFPLGAVGAVALDEKEERVGAKDLCYPMAIASDLALAM